MSFPRVSAALGAAVCLSFAVLAFLLLATGSGCTRNRPVEFQLYPALGGFIPGTARSGPVGSGNPLRGGTLRVALYDSPRGVFNPILAYTESDKRVCDVVFEGLVRLKDDLKPGPGLAEKWEISPDGREIVFHLRDGLKWHDGQPVTAEDVEFTIWSILHPRYQGPLYPDFEDIEGAVEFHKGERASIQGVKVINSSTIAIRTRRPYSPILMRLTVGILPRHLLGTIPPERLPQSGFNSNPIGCGPFVLVHYEPERYIELRGFDGYCLGKPFLEKLIFRVIRERDLASAFEWGDVDVATLELPYDRSEAEAVLSRIRSIPGTRIMNLASAAYQYIGLNLDFDLFKDKSVRQALMYGINRTEMAQAEFLGFARPLNGPFPSCFRFGNTSQMNEYQFDPSMASLLLAEAGWLDSDGDGVLEKGGKEFRFTLSYPADDLRRRLAERVQKNLGAIGVAVALDELKFQELQARVFDERNFEAFVVGIRLPNGLDQRDMWHSSRVSPMGWNAVGYRNPASDQLLDMAVGTLDDRAMEEIYDRWQRLINEELPSLFLVEEDGVLVVRTSARGVNPIPFDLTWNVHEWRSTTG